jgi:pimeloyl-ACP methyl ester carboxylesterase
VLDGGITRTVCSGKVELAVAEGGDSHRPTVVFIHGYPDTKELWDEVLAGLGRRYHLIAYDVRGAGASSRPRRPAAYDLARLADDLEAVIAAVSPQRPVHLVGHDWGAIQGWEFVALERFRNKLASLTAIAGPPLDRALAARAQPPTPGRSGALPRQRRRSWYVVALCTPGVPTLTWRWLLAGPRWAWFLRNVERLGEKAPAPAVTLAADGIHGSKLYRRNVLRRTLRPRTDAVAHVPVQLVIPIRDHFIPPSYYDGADRLAPVLRRRVVGATHWVPRTEPGLIARWVTEFVDQVEAGETTGSRAPWVRGGGLDQLRGRLALVTGAASGIGRATATALARRGARVLLVDRDGSALQRAQSEMGAAGTFVCDVSDERAMERHCEHLLSRCPPMPHRRRRC